MNIIFKLTLRRFASQLKITGELFQDQEILFMYPNSDLRPASENLELK